MVDALAEAFEPAFADADELAAALAAWPETPVELGAAVFYSIAMLVDNEKDEDEHENEDNNDCSGSRGNRSTENNRGEEGACGEDVATRLRCLRNAAALRAFVTRLRKREN